MIEQGKLHASSYKAPSKAAWRRAKLTGARTRVSFLPHKASVLLPPLITLGAEKDLSAPRESLQGLRQPIERERRPILRSKPEAPEQYDEWKVVVDRLTAHIEKSESGRIASRVNSVQKICEAGIAAFGCSLLVKWSSGLELVNSKFAVFVAFSLSVYWAMAWIKKRKL